jgi:hypothetical protein
MPFRLVCLMLLFPLAALAQGDTLSLSQGSAGRGTVALNVTLTSASGQQPAGIQWTVSYSGVDFTAIQVTAGPAGTAAGKSVACSGTPGAYMCILLGLNNNNTIANGVAAVISLAVSPNTTDTSSFVQLENPIAVSPLGTAIPITAMGVSVPITPGTGGGGTPPSASLFVPVVPCRVADTRNADGAFGGPPIGGRTAREFVIPAGACDIPSTATAYSLNVAVVPADTLGYLTVWPTGQSQPLVATLNSLDGRIKSNAAIVPAGAGGAISVFATDTTDVILDINGYFVPPGVTAALAFYPLTPCRIADTQNPDGPLGGPSLAAQTTRAFPILESACGVPAAAVAYSLNFAAVPKGPLGYLTAWPAGQPQPVVASLNDVKGTTTANAVIVLGGANGDVNVFATNPTDLVIDIDGYFAPPQSGGLSLYNLTPCRVLDTRQGGAPHPFQGTRQVPVSGHCSVPPGAQAYVFNATVVPPAALGYLTLWPEGQPQPVVATLNAVDGAITSNMAIVPTKNGLIDAFASDATQLILDVFGYFAP